MRVPNTSTADMRRRVFYRIADLAKRLRERNPAQELTLKQAQLQVMEALNRRCVTDVIDEQLDYQVNEEE